MKDMPIFALGDGYDRFTRDGDSNKSKKTPAVTVDPKSISDISVSQYGYQIDCIQVTDTEDNNLNLSLHLAATFPAGEIPLRGQLSTGYTHSKHVEEYYLHYLVSAYAFESSTGLSIIPPLTDDSKSLVQNKKEEDKKNDFSDFYRSHGDSYITQVNYGRRLDAIITVKRKKTNSKKKFEFKPELEIPDAAKAQFGLEKDLENLKSEEITNISCYGTGCQIEMLGSDLKALKAVINNFFKQPKKADKKVAVSYVIKTYDMVLRKAFSLEVGRDFADYLDRTKKLVQELDRLYIETAFYCEMLKKMTDKGADEDYKTTVIHYQQQIKMLKYFKYINQILNHYIKDLSRHIFKPDATNLELVGKAISDIEVWLQKARDSDSFTKLIDRKLVKHVSKFDGSDKFQFNANDFIGDKSSRYLFFSATPQSSKVAKQWEEKPDPVKILNFEIIDKDQEVILSALKPKDAPDFSCNWLLWSKSFSFRLRRANTILDKTQYEVHEVPVGLVIPQGIKVIAYLYYKIPSDFDFSKFYYLTSTIPGFDIDIFAVSATNIGEFIIKNEKGKQNKVVAQGGAGDSKNTDEENDSSFSKLKIEDGAADDDEADELPVMFSIQEEENGVVSEKSVDIEKIKSRSPKTMQKFFAEKSELSDSATKSTSSTLSIK